MTLAAVGLIGAVLLVVGIAAAVLAQHLITSRLTAHAARAAQDTAAAYRHGATAGVLPARDGVTLLQVVSTGRTPRVLAASAPLQNRAPLSHSLPPSGRNRVDTRVCGDPAWQSDCLNIVGYRTAVPGHGTVMVYGAVPEPWALGSPVPAVTVAGLCIVVVIVAAGVTWRAVGRTLRPVAQMETAMSEITSTDLSRRMPVPDSADEVARLAATLNATLDRLQRSAEQQRRFVADASHELRTPLTALRTRVELALAAPEESDLLETLRECLDDAERLHHIVEDLLALARLDAGVEPARVPLDLGRLVETELAQRSPRLPVSARVDPGVRVEGNRLQLARLLVNLLTNADRYASGHVEVVVRAEGEEAVVEVCDDGPGIPSADRERVFQRFTRLDTARSRAAGGTGLGLTIARDIAVAHGGRLYVADSLRGARLMLRLPLLRDADRPGPVPSSDRSVPPAPPEDPSAPPGPSRPVAAQGSQQSRWGACQPDGPGRRF
ncbi:HAMP domain-containing sensor histidine kinase [Actinomadura sp. NPDC047616]|uniref:sensor histidine kinase n=1 Tax=Actinomadura sp. NPDC047616 TaxID=3155914 RepID=UPI0033CB0A8B